MSTRTSKKWNPNCTLSGMETDWALIVIILRMKGSIPNLIIKKCVLWFCKLKHSVDSCAQATGCKSNRRGISTNLYKKWSVLLLYNLLVGEDNNIISLSNSMVPTRQHAIIWIYGHHDLWHHKNIKRHTAHTIVSWPNPIWCHPTTGIDNII